MDVQATVVGKHVKRVNQPLHHEHHEHHAAQGRQRQFDPKEIHRQHRGRQKAEDQRLPVKLGMKCPYHHAKNYVNTTISYNCILMTIITHFIHSLKSKNLFIR